MGKLLACNFIKKETPTLVFFCEYCEVFKNTCFEEHLLMAVSDFLEQIQTSCFWINSFELKPWLNFDLNFSSKFF